MKKGEKVQGYIIATGFKRNSPRYSLFKEDNYYIEIMYDNKVKKIYNILNNQAYKQLQLSLNPYPVKYNVKNTYRCICLQEKSICRFR